MKFMIFISTYLFVSFVIKMNIKSGTVSFVDGAFNILG